MKKLLLLLVISTLNFNAVKAQTNVYHFFPDSNAFWQYMHWNSLNSTIHDQTRYGLNGDTTIKGNIYHKVYSLFDSTIATPGPNFHNIYYAAIREETKKVYTVLNYDTSEVLLYDFNAVLGDTIHYTSHYPSVNFSRVVTKIDSILLLDGKYRKRYSLASGNNITESDTVVEGIGSIYWVGLFNPLVYGHLTNGDGFQFTCFKDNDTALYVNNPACNHCFCTFTTGVNTYEIQITTKISPNPFSTETTLQVDNELNNATLSVYNCIGQQVKQIKNINKQTISIQRGDLPSGVYFVNITQGGKVISSNKLVIVD